MAAWIAVDDGLPDYPSVVWRKRHHPKVVPTYRVNSILTVMEMVALARVLVRNSRARPTNPENASFNELVP